MKPLRKRWQGPIITAFVVLIFSSSYASFLQLVTPRDNLLPPVAGGGGSSLMPIVSPDGRYVLFASPANNLLLMSNGVAMPVQAPPAMNLYLRDRASNTTTLVSVNLAGPAAVTAIPCRLAYPPTAGLYFLKVPPPTWSPMTRTMPRTSLSATWSTTRPHS